MSFRRFLTLLILLSLLPVVNVYAAQGGSEDRQLTLDGRDRTYHVYKPSGFNADKPAPLVIMLHGGFGSGAQAEKSYGWDEKAEKEGFIVAYPDGIRRSWNAGGICCGTAAKDKIDDLGFITKLIAEISRNEHIDQRRVFLTGMSNGAAMAYRYGCEGPFPVAAVGVVSGSFSYDCPHPHAVSVMEIHGLEDKHIPMEGGIGPHARVPVSWLPVRQTIDSFRTAANCQKSSVVQAGPVKTETSQCADNKQVILITVLGAGHQWPGSRGAGTLATVLLPLDPPSQALDATSTLWNFFQSRK